MGYFWEKLTDFLGYQVGKLLVLKLKFTGYLG